MLNFKTKIALDFETNGVNPYIGHRPFVVGMEDEEGKVLISKYKDKNWNIFESIVQDDTVSKICHNAKFEIKMTKHLGLTPRGDFHDTMILAALVNEYTPLNIDFLSRYYFKDSSKDVVKNWLAENKSLEKQLGRELNYSDIPDEILLPYLEGDLDKTLKLFWLLYPKVKHNKKLFSVYKSEIRLAKVVVDMEDIGVRIDVDKTYKFLEKFKKKMTVLENDVYTSINKIFNLASHVQLANLIKSLGIKTNLTPKGNPKTGYDDLMPYKDKHPFINALVIWKAAQKMVSTYLKPFIKHNNAGIIHPTFWPYSEDKGIVTGRFSSSEPSLHTLPSRRRGNNDIDNITHSIKELVIPREECWLLFFDFKQIEMRIFAHYIEDNNLIEQMNDGVDPYLALANILFGESFMKNLKRTDETEHERVRDVAKSLALGFIYGMGAKKLAIKLKIEEKKAAEYRKEFFNKLPKAQPFILKTQKQIYNNGYVQDIFGRRYHVPIELSYKGVNALCQGTAAQVMKTSMIRAESIRPLGFWPFASIHDEYCGSALIKRFNQIVIEGKKVLEDFTTFRVPMIVDTEYSKTNWGAKEKYVIQR